VPDFSQRLTRDFVDQAQKHYQELWGETHSQWRENDEFVELRFPVWSTPSLNAQRPSHRPARARSIIEHAVDVLLAFDPVIRRPPPRDSQSSEERSDTLEEALTAIVLNSWEESTVIPPRHWFRNALIYGYAVLEAPVFDTGVLAAKPKRPERGDNETEDEFTSRMTVWRAMTRHWNPVRFRVPHPSSILLDPDQKKPPMAIKSLSMTAIDLHELSKRKKRTRRSAEVYDADLKMAPLRKLCGIIEAR